MRRPTLVFGELLEDLDTIEGRVTSYIMYSLNIVFIFLYMIGTFSFTESYSNFFVFLSLF